MKFSFYEKGGIGQTKPSKFITLNELFLKVRNNPNVGFYEHLRNLRITDKARYDNLKKTLPFSTPHVEATERALKGDVFHNNFRSFSNLMYFDMDDVEDILNVKQRIINQYRDFVSFVCISPSGKGLSIILQIKNDLTRENFNLIWHSIYLNEFKNEGIDTNSTGIGRPMFLSYDPDAYYNPDAYFTFDANFNPDVSHEAGFTKKEKVGNQDNSVGVKFTNYVNSHISNTNTITRKKYRIYSINEILSTIITSTPVQVDNEIVDLKEVVDYVSMYIPRTIIDGKKRSTYLIMIHQLFHLNPDLPIDLIYSYIWFINNVFANPRMGNEELLRHFNNVVDQIHKNKMVSVNYRTRRIHWNQNCQFLKLIDKETIAKRLVGLHTRHKNQLLIVDAIEQLNNQGAKITNRAIKELTGKDIKTIRNYRDKPLIDKEAEIKVILDELIPQNPDNMCA